MPASSIKGLRKPDRGPEPLGFRPLYGQVREVLVSRLIDGSWPPGMLLPSEMQLAAELGVSQGTVRKALDAMAADNLLIRQQGRGTFVAEPEDGRMLFQFFRLGSDDGRRGLPDSTVIAVRRTGGHTEECERLALAPGSDIWRIDRTRQMDGRTLIVERITLPADRFAGLDEVDPIPNNVYALYSQRFGQTIARAGEELKAVAASADDTRHLGCPAGTPLLQINRIGYGLDDAPVEWRVSRCLTDGFHYSVSLK
jgi:GntR family transcriptional regulator